LAKKRAKTKKKLEKFGEKRAKTTEGQQKKKN